MAFHAFPSEPAGVDLTPDIVRASVPWSWGLGLRRFPVIAHTHNIVFAIRCCPAGFRAHAARF